MLVLFPHFTDEEIEPKGKLCYRSTCVTGIEEPKNVCPTSKCCLPDQ